MSEQVDAVVIGAGVVGLACARALALAGREVIIIERNDAFGMETSSRNSEVVHAGMYYPEVSEKARLCVRGRHMLYEFCKARNVEHRRCGKLIVATSPEQALKLKSIEQQASRNGVDDLRSLSREEALEMEPALQCSQALLSPSTGIVDSHGFMLALLGDTEAQGGVLAVRSTVTRLSCVGGRIRVAVEAASGTEELFARIVINASGHSAAKLATTFGREIASKLIPKGYLAKGNYFTLPGRSPFQHLIYPIPEPGGLGVHLTVDLGHQARFGPDVEWVDKIDYSVNPIRAKSFYTEIRKYWPEIQENVLQPGYSGIRPKISAQGAPDGDFVLQGEGIHGIPGLVNLFGIESPGLTASMAIAERVVALVCDKRPY
jgi:L-2-hydroxyglutarate oxidase LhgO